MKTEGSKFKCNVCGRVYEDGKLELPIILDSFGIEGVGCCQVGSLIKVKETY